MNENEISLFSLRLEQYIQTKQFELVRQLAFEFLGKGQKDRAALCFKVLKDANPADIQARTLFVQTTLTNNQPSYAAAREEFLSILKDYPDLIVQHNEFAYSVVRNAVHTCIWTNDFEKAKELLESLVKRSGSASDFNLLKDVYSGFGDVKGELWARKETIRLDQTTYGTSENLHKIAMLQDFITSENKQKKIKIRRYPTLDHLTAKLDQVISEHVIKQDTSGLSLPAGQDPFVLVMGGCWHRDFGHGLAEAGVSHHFLPIADQINTPASNLGFFEWLCDPEGHYFKGYSNKYIPETENAESIRAKLAESNIIVITYTKAFELIDLVNSRVAFDEISIFTMKALTEKYQFRLGSVEENVRAIVSTIRLLRTINSSANIVLQISPSPLFASVGDDSTICNDFLSKSMLRISINEVVSSWKLPKVTYWPTIEIFRWIASHQTDYFGGDDGSAWHVSLDHTKAMVRALIQNTKLPG